jgi:hypothetical protein
MGRKELFALKLQMGIDPSVRIEPSVLQAMWQQLKLESAANTRRKHANSAPHPNPVTNTPMVV